MNEGLFRRIAELRESIPENEQEEIVAAIIDIFKKHKITFSQAYNMLGLAKQSLSAISETLVL